jgi:glycosyltransferase involved in cell wall biosynthesis
MAREWPLTAQEGSRPDREPESPRRHVVVAAVAYVISLSLAYQLVLSPAFESSGLVNRLTSSGAPVLALALASLPSGWMPIRASRPSDVSLWVIYLIGYVPSLVIPPFLLGTRWSLLPLQLVLTVSFLSILFVLRQARIVLPAVELGPVTYAMLLGLLGVIGVGGVIWIFGIPTSIPSLDTVGETRAEYKEELTSAGRLAGYAIWWTGQVVAPLLMAYGIWARRRALAGIGVVAFILVYAVTGFRSMIFGPLLLLGLLTVIRLGRWRFGAVAPTFGATVIVVTALLGAIGWLVPVSLLVRRLVVVPGQLMAYYYDFFSQHDTYALSHSVLGFIFDRPYPASPPVLIGERYFSEPGLNANGNLWADGMANFGLIGVIAASLLLALLLLVLDAAARAKPLAVVGPASGMSLWAVTNSGLLTSMLTHGIALFVALAWLLPRRPPRRASRRAGDAAMARVAHLTTVHRPDDPRILLKECATLRGAGYDVVLVGRGTPPPTAGEWFVSIGEPSGRLHRMTGFALRMLRAARRQRAAIYHFHDPELMPVGIALKLGGAKVIYDTHEDLPRQIAYKAYLAPMSRGPLSVAAAVLEGATARVVDAIVAATPRIAARFPRDKTVTVQNFPLLSEFEGLADARPYRSRPETVAYVGRITREVGALVMADAARIVAGRRPSRFVLAGPVDPATSAEMRSRAAPAELDMPGWTDRPGVARILGDARVGLVLFQPVANYVEAYPTKLFEYMAGGVPVVASDFPVWREIVDGADCGILVDPRDPSAVADAILKLLGEPERAEVLGRNGRRAVIERYRWEPQGQRLVELYGRLLAED